MRVPMARDELKAFPPGVEQELRAYVYRLIDPRDGQTFYVGRGHGNRVFQHVRAADGLEGDAASNKIKRIHDIRADGFEVAHVIHRHGMSAEVAAEVEAALIDAYPGLTNIAPGEASADRGTMHSRQIIERYHAEEIEFRHRCILISVNNSRYERDEVYEAVRYAWRMSINEARKGELVLATERGLVVGVYRVDQWLPATSENFPGRDPKPGRIGFIGREAESAVRQHYLRRRVPDRFRRKGAANPVKYSWNRGARSGGARD